LLSLPRSHLAITRTRRPGGAAPLYRLKGETRNGLHATRAHPAGVLTLVRARALLRVTRCASFGNSRWRLSAPASL
jgi:hypothetical protein